MKKNFRIIKFKKNKPILQIKGVSKSFDGRPVLKKIDMEVFPGEIVGLVGPNGSGKSTLYGTIIGQYKVDSGDIFINQKKVTELPIHKRANLGVSYLSQFRNVFDISVFDNLMGVAEICIDQKQKRDELVNNLISEFNLSHLRTLKASVLSGGETRRLQIARTLITKPKVILLDEPLAALDPIIVQEIQNYILKLQAQSTGVIITDHNINNLLQIVDRLYVIASNSIIASGKKEDVLRSDKAKKLYFGSFDN